MGKVIGVDVSKNFIIAYDGKSHWKITLKDTHIIERITDEKTTVVMEQTGAYGIKFAQLFARLGAKVFFADGKAFKRFRMGRKTKKSDYIDAMYLREFFFKVPPKCYPYDMKKHHLRAIVRQHIRNTKDTTKHANRLKQYLAIVFPDSDYYELKAKALYKHLDEIEERLKTSIHHYRDLALLELQKFRIAFKSRQYTEEELKNFARNSEDWEILKTFPLVGEITASTLMAYYQDVRNFKSIDAFVGYMLAGVNYEQSGQVEKHKPDRARTEVKAILFNVFWHSHKKKAIFKPLVDLVYQLRSDKTRHGHNARVIKFIDFFLRIVWYALKHRVDFESALRMRILNIAKAYLMEERRNPFKANEVRRSLLAHIEVLARYISSEYDDISQSSEGGSESINLISELFNHFLTLAKAEVEYEPQQDGLGKGGISQAQGEPPKPEPENHRRRDQGVPPYLRRKRFDQGQERATPPLCDRHEEDQTGEEIPF